MVKNIIFDFGNVLFDLDLPKMRANMIDLMSDSGKTVLQLHLDSGFFNRYETGKINTATFVETLRRCNAAHLPIGAVENAWNSVFLDFPKHRLDMLLELRKNYKVILLSNINDLHLQWIHAFLEKEYGITDFETAYFDHVFYSHLIGRRKPDVDIYRYMLDQTGIVAEESIFFDDLHENIAAAEQLGIRGAWHEVGREILGHVEFVLNEV